MVAYVPAASTLEVQMTSGEFRADLFELANGEDFATDASYQDFNTVVGTVASNAIVLTNTTPAAATSGYEVYIKGLTQVTASPAANQFSVAVASTTTTITFHDGDFTNNEEIEISYRTVKSAATSISVSNDQAAIGEVVMKWPVKLYAA